MKPYYKRLLVVLFLILSVAALAQNKADTAKISFIKNQYAEINKDLKSYKKVAKTDTAQSTEGNEVLLYYSGNEIKKIAATYYGETGKALDEFYFFDNRVIFCYCVDYHYDVPIYAKNGRVKITSTTEERFYLSDGKIFLVKKKPSHSDYFSEFPVDPVKEARRLINLKHSDED
ncbi:MAG: hypothetical protein JO080_02220 [Mucilaginibacter sp.]|nr:hypothetical protein [Mucilaginibacter sp.]